MSRNDIIDLMERKYRDELDLYRVLYSICVEQEHAIRRDSVEDVIRLARAKAEVMKQIRELESEIQALRAALNSAALDQVAEENKFTLGMKGVNPDSDKRYLDQCG